MKKERLTGTLTRTNRPLQTFLAGIGIEGANIAAIAPFANKLECDARAWLARGRYGERGIVTKRDADVMLAQGLAALAKARELEGGVQ